jgi:hypothetical protein
MLLRGEYTSFGMDGDGYCTSILLLDVNCKDTVVGVHDDDEEDDVVFSFFGSERSWKKKE